MTTYEANEFGEVVMTVDGHQSNSTLTRRDLTEFEEQLLEEIKELKEQIEILKEK